MHNIRTLIEEGKQEQLRRRFVRHPGWSGWALLAAEADEGRVRSCGVAAGEEGGGRR